MNKPMKLTLLFCIALAFLVTGCLAWEPGWKAVQQPSAKGDVKAILATADRLANEADSKEKVQKAIDAYEEAAKIEPNNVDANKGLGLLYFLTAYSYTDKPAEKKPLYLKALQCDERVMYANPEFKALADKGEPVWEACRALTKNDLYAMYRWYLSLGNCWNECYSMLGRLVNFAWPGRDKKVLDRMTELDPNWYSGSIQFCWAAYYAVLPGCLGGDLKKAEKYWDKALAIGPHMTNFYVARATYLRVKSKDRAGFVEDLHHAIAIDPRKADALEYPWAAWYKVRAAELLKDTDKYFK
jgi:tetratricopeptide (TPR) repeat protein